MRDRTLQTLQSKAERLLSQSATDVSRMGALDVQALVFELQTYQIELELQNHELQQVQQAMAAVNDRYQQLYNESPVGYLTLSAKGQVIACNPVAGGLLSLEVGDNMERALQARLNDEDYSAFRAFLKIAFAEPSGLKVILGIKSSSAKVDHSDCNCTDNCACPQGQCVMAQGRVYVECRGRLHINANKQVELALSVMDVTESKRAHNAMACMNLTLEKKVAEQTQTLTSTNWDLINKLEQLKAARRQLHEREALLQSMFNHVSEAIITSTGDGLMVDVNQATLELFGYSREQLLNQPLSRVLPCGVACLESTVASEAMCGKAAGISTINGLDSSGQLLPLDVSFTLFVIESQRYTTIIIRDGRPRLALEAREQAHLDELAHVTRLGLMGELASGIAHELNQPLTGVVNYSEVALTMSQQPHLSVEALQTVLQKINEQGLKAGQIIHHMREFLQNRSVRQQPIAINALVAAALDLCEPMIKQAAVTLNVVLDGSLPECCGDSIQIEQVIINLIRNSIDAFAGQPTDEGRMLSIHSAVTADDAVEVRIKDNGVGIPEAAIKQIFQPFYTSKDHGMGMGLSICRSIIQAHGGVLRFNSLPSKGTTFYFTLPIWN